jgi:protocatechuate 3,4-dioxygenase beta subunit
MFCALTGGLASCSRTNSTPSVTTTTLQVPSTTVPIPDGTFAATCTARESYPDDAQYIGDSPDRSDIRTDTRTGQEAVGITLNLTLSVRGSVGNTCVGSPGSIIPSIEIWQPDATGRYSGALVGGSGAGDVLRGQQTSSRLITFTTILPGAPSGRTPHINLKIGIMNDRGQRVVFSTTLYFEQTFIDAYLKNPVYQGVGAATSNHGDPYFSRQNVGMILHPAHSQDTDPYYADVNIPLDLS